MAKEDNRIQFGANVIKDLYTEITIQDDQPRAETTEEELVQILSALAFQGHLLSPLIVNLPVLLRLPDISAQTLKRLYYQPGLAKDVFGNGGLNISILADRPLPAFRALLKPLITRSLNDPDTLKLSELRQVETRDEMNRIKNQLEQEADACVMYLLSHYLKGYRSNYPDRDASIIKAIDVFPDSRLAQIYAGLEASGEVSAIATGEVYLRERNPELFQDSLAEDLNGFDIGNTLWFNPSIPREIKEKS